MLGGVVGDMVGSVYERRTQLPRGLPLLTPHSRYTDDTVFSMAVAEALLNGDPVPVAFRAWSARHPDVGASRRFTAWLQSGSNDAYGGDTNGCLMRVSPAVFMADSVAQALTQAVRVTAVTHDSAVALAAVRVYALALWRALDGARPDEVMGVFDSEGVQLRDVADIHAAGKFRMRADQTLADVYACLASSRDFESVMRQCLHCGGDVDTLCAVAGPIAEALWGIPETLAAVVLERLPTDMRCTLEAEYACVSRLAHMPWHLAARRWLAAARRT